MRSPGINGEELRGQPADRGSPGKMAVKMECVCVHVIYIRKHMFGVACCDIVIHSVVCSGMNCWFGDTKSIMAGK